MRTTTRRDSADGIAEAVAVGGRIKLETLKTLIDLLEKKTDYPYHFAVEIQMGAMLKTLDNEADVLDAIERLQYASDKPRV